MLKLINKYIKENGLCSTDDCILVAVSGGADSVVLLHLLHQLHFKVALAHCNFNLRGNESDQDEQFVRILAGKYQTKGHFKSFDTKEYAAINKISIEMAARELRYDWFEKLCSENGYSKIATGHHLNDSIETLILNLTRGTGINGLTGIASTNGKIIRPLLFATRNEIEEFAKAEKLEFRNDSSNESAEYKRNIIRLQVVPALKNINPSFEQVMKRNIINFSQAADIYNQNIQKLISELVELKDEMHKVDIKKLQNTLQPEAVIYELLSPLGFSNDTVIKLFHCLGKDPGRMFYSESHQLLIDRNYLIIEPIKTNPESIIINDIIDFRNLSFKIDALYFSAENYTMCKSQNAANLDAQKVKFPLKMRHWKSGDWFYPLGMKHPKKMSDFFTDLKIDRFTKDKIWILESGNEIVWVVGYRIDDRFKITTNTKQVLALTLQ